MASSEIKRLKIKVKGRVQGVGFRYFTNNEARLYGIKGYVRNCIDGTVEIDAEGSPDVMDIFLQKIEQGPGYSTVDHIEKEILPFRDYPDFQIKY